MLVKATGMIHTMYFNRVKYIGNFQLQFTKKANSEESTNVQELILGMQYQLMTLQKRYAAFLEFLKKVIFAEKWPKTAIFPGFWHFLNFRAP